MAESVSVGALRDYVAALTDVVAITVEGVARTGAFDQAGTVGTMQDLLRRLLEASEGTGIDAQAIVNGANNRLENKAPHIKRLYDG